MLFGSLRLGLRSFVPLTLRSLSPLLSLLTLRSLSPFRSSLSLTATSPIFVVSVRSVLASRLLRAVIQRHYALWSRSRWFVFSRVAFPCFCCRFFSLVFSLRSLFNGSRVCALLSFLFSPFAVLALVASPLFARELPPHPLPRFSSCGFG